MSTSHDFRSVRIYLDIILFIYSDGHLVMVQNQRRDPVDVQDIMISLVYGVS